MKAIPIPTSRKSGAHRHGFTMVEVLIVIALMGMMLSLALPAFQGIGAGAKVTSAIMGLRGTVSLARQWAISHNEDTYVVFPAGGEFSFNGKKLRSYTVIGEKSGLIKEWVYLPDGVYFHKGANWDGGVCVIRPGEDESCSSISPEACEQLGIESGDELYLIGFDSLGQSIKDTVGTLRIYLAEGYFNEPTDANITYTKSENWGCIQVRGLTGNVRISRNREL